MMQMFGRVDADDDGAVTMEEAKAAAAKMAERHGGRYGHGDDERGDDEHGGHGERMQGGHHGMGHGMGGRAPWGSSDE
jgi:hypothetical protein